MPLALIAIAFFLVMTAIKGNYTQVGQQFQMTFFGSSSGRGGFIVWFGSLLGIALIFRLIGAAKGGELFIALLLVVYAIQNPSLVSSIESAIQGAGTGSSSQGSLGSLFGSILQGTASSTSTSNSATVSGASASLGG